MMLRALVIGSSSGLGEALLSDLRSRGIKSFGHSRIDRDGYDLIGDASSRGFPEKLSTFVQSRKVNLVFFCAGSYSKGTSRDVSRGEALKSFHDNLLSGIQTISALSRAWTKERAGKLVIINSVASLEPTRNESLYGAMKSALSYFAKSARLEGIEHGLQIVEIFPGAVKTRMTRHRENWDHFMEPFLVARTVVDCAIEQNLLVNSIEIRNLPN